MKLKHFVFISIFHEKHHGNCNYFMILFDKWPPKLNVGGVRRLRRGNTKNYLFPSSAVCCLSPPPPPGPTA